jgi:hypothetical protein
MKNIDQIIKKTLSNYLISENLNTKKFLIEREGIKFKTYRQPSGNSLLIPEDLNPTVNFYDQEAWLSALTNSEAIRKNYSNYVSSTNDIYAKSCNDTKTIDVITQFNEKWIDKYIKILDVNSTTPYPNDLSKEDGIKYYFTNKKLREHFGDNLKPIDFMGTDYYFLKLSQWISATYKDLKFEKGNVTKLNNQSIATLMGKETVMPGYLKIETSEVELPESLGGGTISANDAETDWFQWSITKNKNCETAGSWARYYNTMSTFVQNLLPESVSEFEVSVDALKKYTEVLNPKYDELIKGLGPNKGSSDDTNNSLEKLDNQTTNFQTENNGKVIYKACWKQTFSPEDGSIGLSYKGYYDTTVEFSKETIESNNAGKCSGNKFPSMALFLSGGDITYRNPETGELWTETNTIVQIPLVSLTVGYQGKIRKKNAQIERGAALQDDEYTWGEFGYDLVSAVEFTWRLSQEISSVGMADGLTSDYYERSKNIASGDELSVFDRKKDFAISTPLRLATKGLFKPEDYIDFTKINEDTEAWGIPKEGLSQYIPGAKKHPKWNQKSPNGKYLYQYYYITYYNRSTGLEQELPLPSSDWWQQYSLYVYKLKNVVSDSWMRSQEVEVGLCLHIQGADNFNSVIETRGDAGWTFKMDGGSGTMFFKEGVNVPVTLKDGTTYYKGYSGGDNPTYGEPGELETYNFYDQKFLDSRSGVGKFWDSHISTIVSIIVGIGIGVVAAPLSEALSIGVGWAIPASEAGATTTNLFVRGGINYVLKDTAPSYALTLLSQGTFTHSRLAVLVEIALDGSVLSIPNATYYFRNGDDVGGYLTLMTMLIPIVSEKKSFRNFSRTLWTPKVAESLSEKMVKRGLNYWKYLDNYKLFNFLNKLEKNEAMAFGELLEQITKGGKDAINEIFEKYGNLISEELSKKGNEALRKRVGLKLGGNFAAAGKGLVAIGVPTFAIQTGIKLLVQHYRNQGKELNEKQTENLKEGLIILNQKLAERYNNFWANKFRDYISSVNPNIVLEDVETWLFDKIDDNMDIFNLMLEKNGYENITPERISKIENSKNEDDKKKMQDHINDFLVVSTLLLEEEEVISEIINEYSSEKGKPKGEISDLSQVQDKFELITEYYGCLSESSLFEFKGAHKIDTGWWWLCFQVNGGSSLKNSWLYFIGKNNDFGKEYLGGFGSDNMWLSNSVNDFLTQFPDCALYKLVEPTDDANIYKKTKEGKIYKSPKSKINWVEVTDENQKNTIINKYFK